MKWGSPCRKGVSLLVGEADTKKVYNPLIITVVPLMCHGEAQGAKRTNLTKSGESGEVSTKDDIFKLGSKSLPRTL